jgi:hypothetical protein
MDGVLRWSLVLPFHASHVPEAWAQTKPPTATPEINPNRI